MAAFAAEVTFIGDAVVILLMAILDQLRQGIGITGTIQIVISTGGLGDFLKTLDLWKLLGLLGLLALGLTLIVAFLFGVGAALATFGAKAILAAAAIGVLVAALIPLMTTIAGFEWEDLAKIGLGFLAIAGFVLALGKAFGTVTADLEKIVPQLERFFTAISKLMTTLTGFGVGDLIKIATGFAGIAGFVLALGKAFGTVTADLEKIVPQLERFFTAISKLMTTLTGFGVGDLIKIATGFAGIAGFVLALGKAFGTVTADLEKIVPQLERFFTAISKLMTTLTGFDVGDLIKIGVGFLAIAGFVYGLGKALATLTDRALAAPPALARFFDAITRLMSTIASFSVGQLIAIAAGFLLIAGFVYGLALALNTLTQQSINALPGLGQLLDALGRLAKLMADMSVGQMVTMVGPGADRAVRVGGRRRAGLRRLPAECTGQDLRGLRQGPRRRRRHSRPRVGCAVGHRRGRQRHLRRGRRGARQRDRPHRPRQDPRPDRGTEGGQRGPGRAGGPHGGVAGTNARRSRPPGSRRRAGGGARRRARERGPVGERQRRDHGQRECRAAGGRLRRPAERRHRGPAPATPRHAPVRAGLPRRRQADGMRGGPSR